ncbi:MAG: hypothetical protein AAF828_00325 [Bacteroidota bacterium]
MFRKQYSDQELIEIIQRDEQLRDRAFHTLFKRHKLMETGSRIARQKGANAAQAQEVATLAVTELYKAIAIKKNYREQGKWGGFFATIVTRQWHKLYQKEKKRIEKVGALTDELTAILPARTVEGISQEEMVRLLRKLGDACRRILLLRAENLSYDRIAELVGLKNRTTVSTRVNQCRNTFQDIIAANLA